jgi:hypothetical protein
MAPPPRFGSALISTPPASLSAGCIGMPMDQCGGLNQLCTQGASVLCGKNLVNAPPRPPSPPPDLALAAASPPPPLPSPPSPPPPCVVNSSAPSCAAYEYPPASINSDLADLCTAMPYMPGCTIWQACQVRAAAREGRLFLVATGGITRSAALWTRTAYATSINSVRSVRHACLPPCAGWPSPRPILSAHDATGQHLHRHAGHARLPVVRGAVQEHERRTAVQAAPRNPWVCERQ